MHRCSNILPQCQNSPSNVAKNTMRISINEVNNKGSVEVFDENMKNDYASYYNDKISSDGTYDIFQNFKTVPFTFCLKQIQNFFEFDILSRRAQGEEYLKNNLRFAAHSKICPQNEGAKK